MLSRKVAWAAALVLALAATASAQPATPPRAIPPSFALLSLVGDQFSVVMRREEIGSNIDPNTRRTYPVEAAVLDDIALDAAEQVVKKLRPVSPVVRFSIRDPRLFDLQDKLLDDSGGLRDALAKLLREQQATRLVLVTKWRDNAQFKLIDGTTGTGKISGLGFYVDTTYLYRNRESGNQGQGFLGPYAYVTVTVVDVQTMKPIRAMQSRESEMNLPTDTKGAIHAWDSLTPQGKVDALERVLRRAVEHATTAALVASAPTSADVCADRERVARRHAARRRAPAALSRGLRASVRRRHLRHREDARRVADDRRRSPGLGRVRLAHVARRRRRFARSVGAAARRRP